MTALLLLTSGLVLHSSRTTPLEGPVLTCDSAHSWQCYSATSLENQTTGTMTCYPTQSHYSDPEPTIRHPIRVPG